MSNCCKDTKKCCGIGFHSIPAALGDDTGEFKPENGAYHNMLVKYEENGALYFYTNDGVWTKLSTDAGGDSPIHSDPIYIDLSFPQTSAWESTGDDGLNIDYDPASAIGSKIGTRFVPSVQYRKLTSGPLAYYSAEEVFDMLERGDDVVFNHVPINWTGTGLHASGVTEPVSKVDELRMTAKQERTIEVSPDVFAVTTTYSGVAYTAGLPLAYGMNRVVNGDATEYSFFTQGVDTYGGIN